MLVRIICVVFIAFIALNDGAIVGPCPGIDLNCTIHRFFGNDCSPTALRAAFPGMYETNTSSFPGMPGSLEISARYKYYAARDRYKPEANLTFTTPQSGAKNYVKGFEIIRVAPGVKEPTCYILDLSNVIWKDNLEELATVFRLELFPLQFRYYHFTLYALPKQETPNDIYDQYMSKYIELPEYIEDERSTTWGAAIFITQNNEEGSVNVRINPPPEDYGFEEFEYSLVKDGTPLYTKQRSQLEADFEGLFDNETYVVWVKPYDPFYMTMDPSKCLCLDSDQMACDHCTTTATKPFTYSYTGPPRVPSTAAPTPKPTTRNPPQTTPRVEASSPTTLAPSLVVSTESQEESSVKVALAIVGVLLGLGLILGAAGFMYYKRCRGSYDQRPDKPDSTFGHGVPQENKGFYENSLISGPWNNKGATKIVMDKKPKLVLLYEEDHQYHRQVVQHFASFLQQHCQCAAMCVEWQLDAPWVHEDIEQADYVVIVNSEGAHQSYMAHYGQKGHYKVSKQMSNINSIRNKFLHDERYDNVVMVYFDYTDEQYLLPDICPGYKYKLLKHFSDFLLHIHKLRRTDNLSLYDLPLDGSFSKKPIGQSLLDSMSKAAQFQTENPNWAKKRLDYTRMISRTSDDSQFDSGLPDDWMRLSSVERSMSIPESSPDQRELLRILDGNSICTVNPADIGVNISGDFSHLPSVDEIAPSMNVQKSRPKLSPHCFDGNRNMLHSENTPTPPTCSTAESGFEFFPPDDLDDNYDAMSRTVSEQMKSIVNNYHAQNKQNKFGNSHTESIPETPLGAPEQATVNMDNTQDKNIDLYLLKVQSGEIPFISCNMDSETISLGGESV